MLDPDLSVLEKLNQAYDLILDALRQAPQLSATSLDLAPLLLLSAMRRAQRSPRLRTRPRYREQELPF